jgi:predicted permease
MLTDLRYAVRGLIKNPGFSAAAILTLALGIGANAAIFSVVDGVLLRRAPVEDLDRLVMVWETDRHSGTTREPASVPDYLDFAARRTQLAGLAAFQGANVNVHPDRGEPMRVAALAITHDFLPLAGVPPMLGRAFTVEEDRPGGPLVAIVSEQFWRASLGGDPGVLGRSLRLNEQPHTIVGVASRAAAFGASQILSAAAYSRSFADRGERTEVDVWVPLQPNPETTPRSTHPIFVLGRLAPGASLESAQQEMAGIAADLERSYPDDNLARGAFVEPLADVVFGPVRPALLALLGAVALVLLVACGNVANLLLVRGTTRAREVAVRAALGADGRRLVRQFLIEGVLLALVATVAGVLAARLGLSALLALAPADVPQLHAVSLDLRVLGVTLAVGVVVGLTFGLLPLRQARRTDLQAALRGVGAAGSDGRDGRLRSALVVAEVALAVILVVGAGLLLRTFQALHQVDPGFRAEGVLKIEYQLPRSRYPVDFTRWPDWIEAHRFNEAAVARVAALPGVVSAAVAGNHPLDHGFTNSFTVVGREAEARDWPEISVRRVTAGYFQTMEVALARGRLFRDADGADAPPVAVINRAAERRFFASQDALGRQIGFWGANRTIVGVVADERFHGLTAATPPAVYLPLPQAPSTNGAYALLARTAGDPAALAPGARGVVAELDPALALFGVEAMDATVSRSLADRRFTLLLTGLFAALALALAAIGAHGVLSYTVAQRTREIGIRMALGARPGEIVRQVVRHALALTGIGLIVGLAGAGAMARLIGSLLFGVTPGDPLTFAVVPLVILGAALMASYLPARRAMRVDPLIALRSE